VVSAEVSKVTEVMEAREVVEVSEVVSRKHRAMVERVGHANVSWAAEAMNTAEAVHAARAMHAAHAAHRLGGQRHWRGKHRHHDSASNSHFAQHDNPPGCHPHA
jgi:hypothetical protein